jgi:citrate lyase subunit beta/citryl-CoA lyase
MKIKIRRSSLILPVNIQKFVEKAYLRGADAIVLDLEDSVPPEQKENARQKIKPSLPLAARGGADVFVRVNKEPSLLKEDLQASIHPGLDGLVYPKTESPEEVSNLVAEIEKLERERGLPAGQIELALLVESPRGLLNLKEIATASSRIQSISIGPEDYCLELGIEPSPEGLELYYAMAKLVVICKANGLMPMGVMGSIGDFRDLKGFEQAARRARQIGCEGASCIHPDQVEILNRVFSPDPAKVAYARRVVEAFEKGLAQGTASVNVDGRMVDIPVYNRAKLILQRAEAIAELERKKDNALALLK